MDADRTGQLRRQGGRSALYFMHALGRRALPPRVEAAGRAFRIETFVKHDFFAATGFYRDEATGERVVVKIGRTEPLFGLPARWMGRVLADREVRFYRRLSDVPNVPRLIGRFGQTGLVHAFVPGQSLDGDVRVPDDFFDALAGLVDALERRGVAAVDTNKPQNILLGDDGRPHLIDFQISYAAADLGDLRPARAILRLFARTDRYHLLKHKARLRPDLMTPADHAELARVSLPLRLHRRLTRPYFIVRRRIMAHLRATGRLMPEGSK